MGNIKITTIKGFFGIFMLILAVSIIFYWENYGREAFIYVNIPVLKEDVEEGTIITNAMLNYMKIEQSKLINNVVTDTTKIVGLETKTFIPKNAQLNVKYFESPNVVLEESEFVFAVPKEWILAFPYSMRRKDTAYFYEVQSNKGYNVNSSAPSMKQTLSNDPNTQNNNIPDTASVSNEILSNLKNPITKATVAYVKDQTNREVVTVGSNSRYDGSAAISIVEIIVNMDTVKALQKAYNEGHQFIIMYQ